MTGAASARRHTGSAIAAVIFAALLSGIVYRYWPSDERSIRRHLSNLAEALSLSSSESETLSITRFAALREYFAPEVTVRFDGQEIRSRELLLERLGHWTPPPGGIAVEFIDVTVRLSDDHSSARVELTAKIATTRTPATESVVSTRRVDLGMTTLDRDWVIATADAGPPD